MDSFEIYKDIAKRTGGDIYIGVAGPVRTGKSTFIKRFMDIMVLPEIESEHIKARAQDELPQSAAGKTVMTTEPKFVPSSAVEISLGDELKAKFRLIDCVGYMVEGAEGAFEDEKPRMVMTPWSEKPMPFLDAAELGTRKVIEDHSTIGVAVTTDGSVTDIPRENYVESERRVVSELKECGKPFVLILNSTKPYSAETADLAVELREEYDVPVIPLSCQKMTKDDITGLIKEILYQFPVSEIDFEMPGWIETLESDHWLKKDIIDSLKALIGDIGGLNTIGELSEKLSENQYIKKVYVENISPGDGVGKVVVSFDDGIFYEVLSETIGMEVKNDIDLIETIKELSKTKKEYDKVEGALNDVRRKGYGIVSPMFEEIRLEEPKLFKQGSRYGIKLKAKGETIHLIKADIETEVSPIVGSEEQSREFINDLISEFESDPEKIWELNIFGRTLKSLVNDGIQNKIYRMPEDAQLKLSETLQKIVNEGSGGLICIIL